MSANLYMTGLWFYVNKGGRAKLRGRELRLFDVPRFPEVPMILAEIEYVPEVRVARIREKFMGWREMERAEILAADALLERLFKNEPEPEEALA